MKFFNIPISDMINLEAVQTKLHTKVIGRKFHVFRRIHSTNDLASRLAAEGVVDGTVVLAEEQTAGRGRWGRKWESCFGKGLWFSVVLRPGLPSTQAGLFNFLAGISVADAFWNEVQLAPDLKWPNDLLIGEKKICGILSEAQSDENKIKFLVLGIGINVNQSSEDFPIALRERAISIYMLLKRTVNRIDLLAEILQQLESNYYRIQKQGFEGLLAEWRSKCPHLGRPVKIITNLIPIEGVFESIANDGSAMIRLQNGLLKRILVGDMSPIYC